RNVMGKLGGYTWNLVDGYPFVLTVHEVFADRMSSARLRACTGFAEEPLGTREFSGVLHDEPAFSVRAAHLDHKIPCLAFAIAEKTHLNVRKDELERLGIAAGPWLNRLKDAIRNQQPDETKIIAATRNGAAQPPSFTLRELRDRLVVETPGQKLAYVVDTL